MRKMSDIPSELLHNILCLVPAEFLLDFRAVCKSWRQLIDDPDFIKSHVNQQMSSPSLGHLLIRKQIGGSLFSFSLEDFINFDHHPQTIEATPVRNLWRRGWPRLLYLPTTMSCNGLILISGYSDNRIWVLWNPLTREFHKLPEIKNAAGLTYIGIAGFGYDYVNDDYKVVCFYEKRNQNSVFKTLVYSLKSDSWKWIKGRPPLANIKGRAGVYLNGVLYWMCLNFIIALDLSTEDYRQLPLPIPTFTSNQIGAMKLHALGGCLFMSSYLFRQGSVLWVMNYDIGGNVASWTMLLSFKDDSYVCSGVLGVHLNPIAYSKSNRHVLFLYDNNLFWLDTNTSNSGKSIRFDDLSDYSISCQVWKPSLFRLRNNVTAGESTIIDARTTGRVKRKMPKKRVKLDITITDQVRYNNHGV